MATMGSNAPGITPPTGVSNTGVPPKDPPGPVQPADVGVTSGQFELLVLKDVNTRIGFRRMTSNYLTQNVTINIDALNHVAGATYDQMIQISTTDLPIIWNNFIRMWKTLILKWAQDVFEGSLGVRVQHYICLAPTLSFPRPFGGLLYNLGQYHSTVRGIMYNIIPPAQPQANIPN